MLGRSTSFRAFVGSLLIVSWQSGAVAQHPDYIAIQSQNNVYFQLAWESPPGCDDETIAGFASWTNVGSRLRYSHYSAQFWSGYQAPNSPYTQVTFQPTHTMRTSATAETVWPSQAVAGHMMDGHNLPVMNDGDIVVNADRWASGMLDCGPAAPTGGQFDLQRVVAHEAGHVAGLRDQYATSYQPCVIYGNVRYGVAGSAPCTQERNALIRLYNSR